jgi:uncharacterized protein (TIGR00369 family)
MSLPFSVRIPFVEHLGFELQRFHGGESDITLTLREELTNSWGVAHGGVTMTLLDVAMASAARSPDEPGGEARPGVVTIEMKTTFMRPGLGRLRATGKLLHRTASMAFCEGSVYSEDGQIAGHATGTFKYMRGLPVGTGGRRIQKLSASD